MDVLLISASRDDDVVFLHQINFVRRQHNRLRGSGSTGDAAIQIEPHLLLDNRHAIENRLLLIALIEQESRLVLRLQPKDEQRIEAHRRIDHPAGPVEIRRPFLDFQALLAEAVAPVDDRYPFAGRYPFADQLQLMRARSAAHANVERLQTGGQRRAREHAFVDDEIARNAAEVEQTRYRDAFRRLNRFTLFAGIESKLPRVHRHYDRRRRRLDETDDVGEKDFVRFGVARVQESAQALIVDFEREKDVAVAFGVEEKAVELGRHETTERESKQLRVRRPLEVVD